MYRGKYSFTMVKRGAIHFGVGISEKTGEIVKSEGCKKVGCREMARLIAAHI